MEKHRLKPQAGVSRRSLCAKSAALSVAASGLATAARAQQPASNLPPLVPEWMTRPGGPFLNPPYGLPSPFEKEVVRVLPGGGPTIPMELALDEAILAYAQNGEMLRPEQGYPLRLLLPGIEGNVNIKWLRRLKVGEQPFYTREETSKYTDMMPDGKAYEFAFRMDASASAEGRRAPSGGLASGERHQTKEIR